jgi:hypothetical protein
MRMVALVVAIQINAVQMDIRLPQSNRPRYDLNSFLGARLARTTMSGGYYTCFLTNLTSQNKDFLMMIDTGATDTIFPSNVVNDYNGPVLDLSIPDGSTTTTSHYGDSSWWTGYMLRTSVGLYGTNVSGLSPVALMINQSTSPIFASGTQSHGLMGLGFQILSSVSSAPYSVMDAWFEQGSIPKNEVVFHGCPYRLESQSWIDFGNETPYKSCSNQSVTIKMPSKSYFTLDLQKFSIGGIEIPFPSTFQSGRNPFRKFSILDSCASLIILPSSLVSRIIETLKNSRGFSNSLSNNFYFDAWLKGEVLLSNLEPHIDYPNLPNITFQIATGSSEYNTTELVLGPRQYIQSDADGYCNHI